jgi:hypothetical protein
MRANWQQSKDAFICNIIFSLLLRYPIIPIMPAMAKSRRNFKRIEHNFLYQVPTPIFDTDTKIINDYSYPVACPVL